MALTPKQNPLEVLLVEDEPGAVRLIEEMIQSARSRRSAKVRIHHVDCLEKAIQHIHAKRVDAVLLDLRLPDSDGLDTVLNLAEEFDTLPIVVLTSLYDEQLGIEAVQAGAQDYLIKSDVGPDWLIRSLQYAIERKKSQTELQHYITRLEQSNKDLETFAYVASHDLQEPLRKVVSFSQLLVEDIGTEVNKNAQRDVDFIVDAAKRMQGLIEDLLRLSRVGRSDLNITSQSLDRIVDSVCENLSAHIEETNARITRDQLPEVSGDSTLLSQVYQNLLSNALKFSVRDKAIEIHLSAESKHGHWHLGVTDNGIGVDPKYAEEIFQPFKKLHGRAEYEGAGIGLAICAQAVSRHGGTIWVEPSPSGGAWFRFTLPETIESDVCHTLLPSERRDESQQSQRAPSPH